MQFAFPVYLLLLFFLPALAVIARFFPFGILRGGQHRGLNLPASKIVFSTREFVSLFLRLVIALCLILSLAGLEITRPSNNLAVVFLFDISDSMPVAAKSAAQRYVQESLTKMGPDDQAALIVFGGTALVEHPMSPTRASRPPENWFPLASIPTTDQTDLGEAIRLALALFPPDAARRMVILSDGADTTGGAIEAAQLAAASGVQIIAVPFIIQPGAEAWVSQVETPAHLRQGEKFNLNVTIDSSQAMRAMLRVLAAGSVVSEESVDLQRGTQTFSLPLIAGQPGFASYRLLIFPDQDTYYQNNEMAAVSQIEGPPKVLLVAPPTGESLGFQAEIRPDEASALSAALIAAGFVVEPGRPSGLPSDLAELAQYVSLVLVDVPAREFSPAQMAAVQSYVRDLGGGLVAVGGPTSYGVGGYFHTPLEETLPIEMQIKDKLRRPSLAIVFVIDHSGSMGETSGGVTKVELAKEAAIRSVDLLFPTDRIGVVAFDDTTSWVVPMTDLSDPAAVKNAIATIRADGGTDILGGLQAMAKVLPGDPAQIKHVILLTDGGADPTGIPELVKSLSEQNNITLSTVGVGKDAAPFLSDLAKIGGGRYHFTADPSTVPSIFTEETILATRAYLVEETFYPEVSSSSPLLAGIQETPPLYGYVATSAKSAAQTILISPKKDPILATWQYGLGRAVAFTSDASGRWAKDWVTWSGFPIFWAQVVRSTIGNTTSSPLDVKVEQTGETANIVVDAQRTNINSVDGLDPYLNGYSMQANVVNPQGVATAVELRQTAPGRYEGTFNPGTHDAASTGAYLIRVTGSITGSLPASNGSIEQGVSTTAGWVLAYSPEYRDIGSNPDLLYRMTLITGGKITSGDPSEAFTHTLTAPRANRPFGSELLMLAVILLPFDIAARRLIVTRADFNRAWLALLKGVRIMRDVLSNPVRRSPAPRSEQMESLLEVKGKANRSFLREHLSLNNQETVVSKTTESPTSPEQASLPAPSSDSSEPLAQSPTPQPPKIAADEQSTTARLLAHKHSKH